jgi:hypothetical protein
MIPINDRTNHRKKDNPAYDIAHIGRMIDMRDVTSRLLKRYGFTLRTQAPLPKIQRRNEKDAEGSDHGDGQTIQHHSPTPQSGLAEAPDWLVVWFFRPVFCISIKRHSCYLQCYTEQDISVKDTLQCTTV